MSFRLLVRSALCPFGIVFVQLYVSSVLCPFGFLASASCPSAKVHSASRPCTSQGLVIPDRYPAIPSVSRSSVRQCVRVTLV